MANPVSETFESWQNDAAGADTNRPNQTTDRAGTNEPQELSGNLRLLKSEIRQLRLETSWTRWKGLRNLAGTGNIVFSFFSPTQFLVNDDFVTRGEIEIGRIVLALGTFGTAIGYITAANFSSPNTTVTVQWTTGSIDVSLSDVWFGLRLASLPLHVASHAAGAKDQLSHGNLAGVTADQHHARDHAATHANGGADPFTSAHLLNSKSLLIHDQDSGIGIGFFNIQDGFFLKRIGANISGSLIGTGDLKTAVGGVFSAVDLAVVMNDYSFFPSLTSGQAEPNNPIVKSVASTADPNNTIAAFNFVGTGDRVARWRYITASDNPTIWIACDPKNGAIQAVWASDDPAPNDQPGIIMPGAEVRKLKAEDLTGIDFKLDDLAAADAMLSERKLKKQHRLYRALQVKAGDPAPAQWLFNNTAINRGSGRLVIDRRPRPKIQPKKTRTETSIFNNRVDQIMENNDIPFAVRDAFNELRKLLGERD